MPVSIPSLILLVAFAVMAFLAVWFLLPRADDPALAENEDLGLEGVETEDVSPVIATLRPLLVALTPAVRWIGMPKYRGAIERRFVTAGMSSKMSTDEFLAYKLFMGLAFWALFILLFARVVVGWEPPFPVHIVVFFLGSLFPDSWLIGQVTERQNRIRKDLPYVLDLLTLSVEAGLDFVAGISKVCNKAPPGPLVDELSFFISEMQVGATRQQALRNLSQRVGMSEVKSFTAMLIQADVLGASVGPVLRAQSNLMRTYRFQAAERQGAYATQKILFPLILFIMPAVFIVIFGPIILNFIYGDQTIGI